MHIARARPVGFTMYLNDGAGYRWDIQYYLNTGQGTNNTYRGGLYCRVHGTNVSSNGRGWVNPAGDEIEIGPFNVGSCVAYRRCKIYRDQGLARWLDIFVNTSRSAQNVPVQIHTNTQTGVSAITTSTGAAQVGPRDWAFITQHHPQRPSLLHVVCGRRSRLRPRVQINGNTIRYDYDLSIPAGGTAVVCYFESQGHTVNELEKRLKGFRASQVLKDLSTEVQKLIVNFRTGDGPEEVELNRSGTSDTVTLRNGDAIFGQIANDTFVLEAFYGTIELPVDQLIGFVQVAGRDELVRAVLAGGQLLTGRLRAGVLKFALPTGGHLNVPFSRVRQCSYRISQQKPEESDMTDPLILLRSGDRLAFKAESLKLTFLTRHGTIPLKGEDLVEIRLDQAAHGVHRAVFRSGAKLAGLLGPEQITLSLKLGPTLTTSRDMVLRVRLAAEVKEDPSLASVKLSNGDELYGRPTDTEYVIATEFGTVKVSPANVSAMSFDPQEPTRTAIVLWDGSTLRGQVKQEALGFALQPGPELALHTGHVVELDCPGALPPKDIVQRVKKHVGMLSAANYGDREEAQKALEQMGPRIAPLLREHLEDPDPEVRHRIGVILEKIGADTPQSRGRDHRPQLLRDRASGLQARAAWG